MAPKAFPNVEMIGDPMAKVSIRLLWDKVYSLSDQLSTAQTALTAAQASITDLQTRLATTSTQAKFAIAQSAKQATTTVPPGGIVDDGLGEQGCSQAGADGHVAPGTALDPVTAGKIVCGTGAEFPALLAPVADQTTRDANAVELLLRMIWHLQQAGFTAGRQINPSGAISSDKLTVLIPGESTYRAYDTMSLTEYAQPITTHMIQVGSPKYLADPGTADP